MLIFNNFVIYNIIYRDFYVFNKLCFQYVIIFDGNFDFVYIMCNRNGEMFILLWICVV